jgi:hypothetical protein
MLCVFFWVIRRYLKFICRFGTISVQPVPFMKMEQTERSETMEYKLQTPANYTEESIQRFFYGESLK